MSFFLPVLITIYCFCKANCLPVAQDSCTININDKKDFSDPQPLILKPNSSDKYPFFYPVDKRGNIIFKLDEQILLACPGSRNSFAVSGWQNKKEQIVKCGKNNQFEFDNKKYTFSTFVCKKNVQHIAKTTGQKCTQNNLEATIGIELSNKFLSHIILCHDDYLMSTLYTQFNTTPAIKGFQRSYPRPNFIEGNFYNRTNRKLDYLYKRTRQQKTFGKLLGSDELGKKYVKSRGDFFLTGGHMTAKADFVFGAQQSLTFYYINTTPQWQVFNSGNWEALESSIRKFCGEQDYELEIYTGTFGNGTLPDVNNRQVQLFLLADQNTRGIPIPKYYWKIVYNRQTLQGIAFVGVNNPYQFNEKDVFCTDICKKISWVSWDQKNVTAGYSFCCEVGQFQKTVTYLPKLDVRGILN